MARTPRPWFREERGGWYVTVRGQRHHLGDHPSDAPSPRKQKGRWNAPASVMAAFHELMAKSDAVAASSPWVHMVASLTVGEVFEKFLDWCEKHRARRTYEWSRGHIQSFCDHLRAARSMLAYDLRPFHIVEWVDARKTWGPNQKRGAIVAVQRPFNWAAKMGYIDSSPVRGVEKPKAIRRESKLTPVDFAELVGHVKDQPFRDLLTFAWEIGQPFAETRHEENMAFRKLCWEIDTRIEPFSLHADDFEKPYFALPLEVEREGVEI